MTREVQMMLIIKKSLFITKKNHIFIERFFYILLRLTFNGRVEVVWACSRLNERQRVRGECERTGAATPSKSLCRGVLRLVIHVLAFTTIPFTRQVLGTLWSLYQLIDLLHNVTAPLST